MKKAYQYFLLAFFIFVTFNKSVYFLSNLIAFYFFPPLSVHTFAYTGEVLVLVLLISKRPFISHVVIMALGLGYGLYALIGPQSPACNCLFGWNLILPVASRFVIAIALVTGSLFCLLKRDA